MAKELSPVLLWHVFCFIFVQSFVLALVHILFVINVFVFHAEKKNAFKRCVCVLNGCHYQTRCQ